MIKLYGVPLSRAFRSLWALEEIGVEYENVPVNFIGDSKKPEYLAINPNGRIPALVDGDLTLFESMAINLYLARKYDGGLQPKALEDEARAVQWSFWGMTEIEPHLLLQWIQTPWGNSGFGPGVRFNIPFLDNGPIDTINNNMAIGFGMDWAIFDDVCGWYWDYRRNVPVGHAGYDCTAHALSFPVVLQWNFYLTDVISVFGEPGLTIQHFWWDSDYCDDYGDYRCNGSDTDLDIAFWGGGRFQVADTVSIIARIGTPYISVGVGFLL